MGILTCYIIRHLVISFIVFIRSVGSVPPEYCLHPLNASDCHMKPTPVFSYYLAGSRCEIEYWRGCPTLNKFDNEFDCSDLCIFRFGRREVEESAEGPVLVNAIEDDNDMMKELLELPEENLTIINELVKQIDVEVVKHVKLHQHMVTLPQTGEIEITTEIATTETETTITEETTTEETTTEQPDDDYESGLPEEVETP